MEPYKEMIVLALLAVLILAICIFRLKYLDTQNVKNNFTRSEVIKLLRDLNSDITERGKAYSSLFMKNWIDRNL